MKNIVSMKRKYAKTENYVEASATNSNGIRSCHPPKAWMIKNLFPEVKEDLKFRIIIS